MLPNRGHKLFTSYHRIRKACPSRQHLNICVSPRSTRRILMEYAPETTTTRRQIPLASRTPYDVRVVFRETSKTGEWPSHQRYRRVLCALSTSRGCGMSGMNDSDHGEHWIYRFTSVTPLMSSAVSPFRHPVCSYGRLQHVHVASIPPMELYHGRCMISIAFLAL